MSPPSHGNILPYAQPQRRFGRRWRLPMWRIALVLVIATLVGIVVRSWPSSSNTWTYPSSVGVDRAMRDIRDAVAAYTAAEGRLPENPESVRAYLNCEFSANDRVTGEMLLPFVAVIPANDDATRRLAGGGRFVLVLYLRKGPTMRSDAALVLGERWAPSHSGSPFFDNDITRHFGATRLEAFKQSAYELP